MNIDVDSLALRDIQEARNCALSCDTADKQLRRPEHLVKGKTTGFMNALISSTVFSDMQRAHVREMDKISSQEAGDVSSDTFRPLCLGSPRPLVSSPRGIRALKLREA